MRIAALLALYERYNFKTLKREQASLVSFIPKAIRWTTISSLNLLHKFDPLEQKKPL